MKVAVVGAGFAGLGAAYHLSKEFDVHVFDQKSSKASFVSAGLCHGFPAKNTKLAFMAQKALHETMCLLNVAGEYSDQPVADFTGIYKLACDNEQKRKLSTLSRKHASLFYTSDTVDEPLLQKRASLFIQNGITVFSSVYLKALQKACEKNGVEFVEKSIQSLDEFEDFDKIVLCVGANVEKFIPKDKDLELVKGQILSCSFEGILQKSVILDGYIAKTESENVVNIGSTYERNYVDEHPNEELAKSKILTNLKNSNLDLKNLKVLSCRSGIRVTNKKNHLPQIKKLSQDVYAITKLGSRGLLYHALLGRMLAASFKSENDRMISREFFQDES